MRLLTGRNLFSEACVRCALLRPDPAQRARLGEIRYNLHDRIAEAEREGWLGEIEGLKVAAATAAQLGLVCFNPQEGRLWH